MESNIKDNYNLEISDDHNENRRKISKELRIISNLLTDICEEGTEYKDSNGPIIKPFISKKIPNVSIQNYLDRLAKYSKIENNTLLLVLIYIDRICELNKIRLNYFNIHKLILGGLLIAIKYNEDDYFSNTFYSKVGGVTQKLIDFNLYVSDELFIRYYDYIKNVDDE